MVKDQELMNAYCWATECNLATLELLKKSNISSKEQIERQTSICNKMVSLVENQLSYRLAVRLLDMKYNALQKAIHGSSR